MLKEIVTAIQSYFKAHQFISAHKLWKWIIVPGVIYAILFAVGIYFFGQSVTSFIGYITEISGIRNWLQKPENSWLGFFFTIGGIILVVILMFFYFSLFKYMWLILGSPVFAYLSEKTSSIIEGREIKITSGQIIKDALRGIRLALRNMLWQTVYTISILLLCFIPVIGWATPILALFVECYYYGFSMLDYSAERRHMNRSKSIAYVGRHKGLAIGNGLVFYLVHFLLIVGWIFAPAYAVVAATISMHEQRDLG